MKTANPEPPLKERKVKFKIDDTRVYADIVLDLVNENEQSPVRVSDDILINLAKAFLKYPKDITIWIAKTCKALGLPIEQAKRVVRALANLDHEINPEDLEKLAEISYILRLKEPKKSIEEILRDVGFKEPNQTIELIKEALRYVIVKTPYGSLKTPVDMENPNEIIDYVFNERLLDNIIAYLENEGIILPKEKITLSFIKIVEKHKKDITYELMTLSSLILKWVAVLGERPNEETLYLYFRGRLYEGRPYIKRILSNVLGRHITAQLVNNALIMVLSKAKFVDREKIDPIHRGLIPFKNGVLDIHELKLIPWPEEPTENTIFTVRVNYEVDPDFLEWLKSLDDKKLEERIPVLAPNFDAFLDRLFENKKQAWEILGKILYPQYVRKLFLIVGPPNVGKSTFLTILKLIFGKLCSSYSLTFIAQGTWLGYLRGKLLNVSSEEPDRFLDVDVLKRLTGEEYLFGNIKFKNPVEWPNIVTLIFALNNLPKFKKIDEAFIDRLYIALCKDEEIESPDREWAKKLVKKEGQGIVHYIIACHEWFKRSGYKFRYDIDYDKKIDLLMQAMSNVYEWAKEELEIGIQYRDVRIKGTKLYDAYFRWCQERGQKPEGRNTFYAILTSLGAVKVIKHKTVYFRCVWLKSAQEFDHQVLLEEPS
ncbi:MAG: DUF5906 domain-containing protein [Candidatus Njordarchaeales archaeon]